MDYTERHITKIAREAAKLAAQTMSTHMNDVVNTTKELMIQYYFMYR